MLTERVESLTRPCSDTDHAFWNLFSLYCSSRNCCLHVLHGGTVFSSEIQCLCSCLWPFLSGAPRQWAGPNNGMRARLLNGPEPFSSSCTLEPQGLLGLTTPKSHRPSLCCFCLWYICEISQLVLRPFSDLTHWLLFLEILPQFKAEVGTYNLW